MRNSFFGILAIFLILVSCEKPESNVGLGLLPSGENLGIAIDSSTVLLYQRRHDSLTTSRFPSVLLGDFYDPFLDDTTKSNLYVQFRLSNPNVDFGDGAELDSLVLSLTYNEYYYGDLDDVKISLHRLSENIYLDSVYRSYSNASFYPVDLADPNTQIVTPDPESDVVVGGDTLGPQLRIKFDTEMSNLGAEFLDPINLDSLANNTNFLKFFKGLRISAKTQSGNGGLLNFDLKTSKMTLYYHLSDPDLDSLSYEFAITPQSQYFTEFTHSYDEAFLNLDDNNPVDDQVYIQANAGLAVEVALPNIYDFAPEDDIIINRAVLEFPVIGENLDLYVPNYELKAVMRHNGVIVEIPDQVLDSQFGTSFTGGVYDADKKVYRLIITRFVQRVLNGQIDEPVLTVIPNFSRTVGNRAILKVGDLNEDRRTKLIINYTTY